MRPAAGVRSAAGVGEPPTPAITLPGVNGRRWARVALATGPALVLAGVGTTHPTDLSPATASWWTTMHTLLLPVFPLLAVSLWLLLRGVPGPAAWLGRVAAYGFAAFYTALDVLAGIATGALVSAGTDPDAREVSTLFAVGNDLGDVGVWCFQTATLATGLALVPRLGRRTLPAAALLAGGAFLFGRAHIYWPEGVLAMVVLAAGLALLAAAEPAPRPEARTAVEPLEA